MTRDGVLSTLKRLSDIRPGDGGLRYRLASGLEEAGRIEEAISEYEKLLNNLENEQDRAAVLKTLGYLYVRQGDREKAMDRYAAAAEIDPEDANLFYNLAGLYDQTGLREKADQYLKMAVSKDTGDISGRLRLAEAAMEKGNMDEEDEAEYLREVLDRRPDSLDAMLLLVNVLDRRGDREGLKPLYRRILEQAPGNLTVAYNLAVLEYETGEHTQSAARLRDILTSNPGDEEALELLFRNLIELKSRRRHAGSPASCWSYIQPNGTTPSSSWISSIRRSVTTR